MLDAAKDIEKQIAESRKLVAESLKREAEFSKLCHEARMSLMAETLKDTQRHRSMWLLDTVALGAALLAFGVVAGVVLAKVFA